MKALLYSLRTQKMELDRRLLELQSTIDSLKDDQKIFNVALQEKQREIKTLRERETESGNENPQVVALTQSLKQKEDELENLRRRLESRGAVAADDPSDSDPRVDSTMSEEPKEQVLESSAVKGGETESMDNKRGESKSTEISEIGTQKLEESRERREGEGEDRQKQENLRDDGEKQEVMDGTGNVPQVDGEESKITNDHKEEEVGDSEAVEYQSADETPRSGLKMETETSKYGRTRKIRGKRWRYIAKRRAVDNGWRLMSKKRKQVNNRNLDDSGVHGMTHRKSIEGGASEEEKKKEEATGTQVEKENKMLKQEELNSTNGDTYREQKGNGDVGDGSIKQNSNQETELNDSKREEKQEPEPEKDGHFNRESNSDVVEEVKEEENKEEIESEF